jgi:hypothetical protein
MRFSRQGKKPEAPEGREEIREIAEALGLYRSAMCHIVERSQVRPLAFARRPAWVSPFRLLLAPVLTAAVVVGIFFPLYSYSHHHVVVVTRPAETFRHNPAALATVDDTALMNQIDSELSQDVPDALEPLADLSDQNSTTTNVSEKKNVTHE